MTDNVALSWRNLIDASGVAFTAGSEVASLPASNLANPIVARPWRTSGTVSSYVEIDLGSAQAVQLLALAGLTGLATTDTIRARLSAVSAGAGELLDTTAAAGNVADGYGIWTHFLTAAVSPRYIRFDINAASLSDQGYFDVGRAWAGPALQPARSYSFGAEFGWRSASRVSEALRSGAVYPDARFKRRFARIELAALTEAEARDELLEMQRLAGLTSQVVLIPTPGSSRQPVEAILGYLRDLAPLRHRLPFLWAVPLEIEEAL